jgi:hypothetical protein
MSRYTEAQLHEMIDQINRMTCAPDTMTVPVREGVRVVFNVGHYYMKRSRNGYILYRITSDDGECSDVFGQGWMTKPELGAILQAYALGLEEARRCVVKHNQAMAWA